MNTQNPKHNKGAERKPSAMQPHTLKPSFLKALVSAKRGWRNQSMGYKQCGLVTCPPMAKNFVDSSHFLLITHCSQRARDNRTTDLLQAMALWTRRCNKHPPNRL